MPLNRTLEDGVATLQLDHPPLNILTRALLGDLRAAFRELADEPGLRAVVLTAAGRHFSAGADVGEHLPPEYAELIPEFADTIETVAAFPLPVIAAVRGRCLGGGFELAQAADLIVAGEGASFGQPEILLGVTAPAACVLLPRRIGYGDAAALLFTGEAVPAARAREMGFVQQVVADDAVEAEAAGLAKRIARHSAVALRETKRTLRETATLPRGDALRHAARAYVDQLMASHDALEGLQAFLEKRPAAWRHR
ncbi:MAG: enoyl-CoA hydratase/isomerase family protein [Candidatus Eisenbacteria bacterium]|nr:enoyl-CoA hydratase/isomerase family protein [Candidatus Eisenbacteria bacterium]